MFNTDSSRLNKRAQKELYWTS